MGGIMKKEKPEEKDDACPESCKSYMKVDNEIGLIFCVINDGFLPDKMFTGKDN